MTVRPAIGVATTMALSTSLVFGLNGFANADVAHHVYRTDGDGLLMHSDPFLASPTIALLAEGAEFDPDCFTSSDDVLGDPLWLHGTSGGYTGWVADYYIDVPWSTTQDLVDQGIPQCGSSGSAPVTVENAEYNRSAAVQYALDHAYDPQAYGAMCTWFVSNALWAGGLEKTATWTDAGRYGRTAPGTQTAWVVPDLLSYLRTNYSHEWMDITGNLTTNAVPQAEPGDIIAYDWDNDGEIDHITLVVNIASGQYPEVSEMGQYDTLERVGEVLSNIGQPTSDYIYRGWTYSEKNDEFLQVDNPAMRAYLLHFNGGVYVGTF